MRERRASRKTGLCGLVAAMAAAAGCATARAPVAPATPQAVVPPTGETRVMLRDLGPGQPLLAFGRWSGHLTPDGSAQLRDMVVVEAIRRGLERVRAASAPPVVVPAPPVVPARPEGAAWGDNVETATRSRSEPLWPTPPPGATWLEITSLVLDQARLGEGPGATALTLEVVAVRSSAALAGRDRLRAVEARFTLLDPEPLPALDAPPGEGEAEALRAATARLLARAAGRLVSLLVPAASPVATPGPRPRPPSAGDPVPEVPLEATYVARTWVVAPTPGRRGRGAAQGAWVGANAGAHLALLGAFCGPFAPACMPALGLVGGGVGLVVGAAAGAADARATPQSGPMQATLPPEPERAAVLETLRRQAEGLSLAAAVEGAALLALEATPGAMLAETPPRLTRVEVRLTGDEGADHPARLALVLTTAPPPGQGGPDLLVQETPDALPAQTWADDDGALLRLVLERAAEAAGKALVARARQAPPPAPAAAAAPTGAVWVDER